MNSNANVTSEMPKMVDVINRITENQMETLRMLEKLSFIVTGQSFVRPDATAEPDGQRCLIVDCCGIDQRSYDTLNAVRQIIESLVSSGPVEKEVRR